MMIYYAHAPYHQSDSTNVLWHLFLYVFIIIIIIPYVRVCENVYRHFFFTHMMLPFEQLECRKPNFSTSSHHIGPDLMAFGKSISDFFVAYQSIYVHAETKRIRDHTITYQLQLTKSNGTQK